MLLPVKSRGGLSSLQKHRNKVQNGSFHKMETLGQYWITTSRVRGSGEGRTTPPSSPTNCRKPLCINISMWRAQLMALCFRLSIHFPDFTVIEALQNFWSFFFFVQKSWAHRRVHGAGDSNAMWSRKGCWLVELGSVDVRHADWRTTVHGGESKENHRQNPQGELVQCEGWECCCYGTEVS